MDLKEAIAHALDGNAVLFIGAGFSCGATNIRGTPFKTGTKLSSYLAKEAGLPDGIALDDAADQFAAKFGADRLIKEMQEEFTVRDLLPSHKQLAAVPWKRVYTTNYDNVFESACAAVGRRLTPVTLSQNIRDVPKDATLCVHLNGFVGSLTRETIWSEVKLTDTSYLIASVADSAWAVLFKQDLEMARSVFYVGYSLWDIDLRRILFEQESLRSKSFFVVGEKPDPATELRTARFGTVLKIDSQALAGDVAGARVTHTKPAADGPLPFCLREYRPTAPGGALADRYVFDLLSFGRVRPEYVWNSLHGGPSYSLLRRAADFGLAALQSRKKVVAFHADLGNGKTLILEMLKSKAHEAGYRVFSLVQRAESLLPELEHAVSGDAATVFFVDNYPDWLNALKFFATNMRDGISLVVAARSSAHDILVDRLAQIVRADEVVEIACDVLDHDDVAKVVTFFNDYGFWGPNAAWSPARKSEFVNRVCRSEWHAILLKLFDSPDILSRFQVIFEDVRKQRNYYEQTVAILILAVVNYSPSLNTLVDLCGQKVLESGFRRDPAIREIIDFSTGEVTLRSAAAAEHILKQVVDVNVTLRVLVSLAKAADRAASISTEHFNIFRSLMRFGSLQFLLPENDKAKAVLGFYEAIKTLDTCRRNPLFWLQYAIACLVIEELDRAQKYFDASYAFAKEKAGFDTYQIDNHYARFLLTKAARAADATQAIQAFRKARTIVFQQIGNERLHYPYRVAIGFTNVYDAFTASWSKAQREEFARAAKHVADQIERLPKARQEQRYVDDCWIAMTRIVEDASRGAVPAD